MEVVVEIPSIKSKVVCLILIKSKFNIKLCINLIIMVKIFSFSITLPLTWNVGLFLFEPIHTSFGCSNHHFLTIFTNFFHFSMLLVYKVSFVFCILSEVNAQISKAFFAFIKIIAYPFASDTIIDRTHKDVMAATDLILETSSCYDFNFDWLRDFLSLLKLVQEFGI